MQVRPAELADTAAVSSLVQRAYEVYVERIGCRPAPMDDDYAERIRHGFAFLADDDGVVGLIVLVREPDHILIENVAVDPSRQGEGIGRTLLAFAEVYARKSRINTLRLYTNAAMTENLALYLRLDYREVDRRSENGFERVFFAKRIDPEWKLARS